MKKLLDIIKKVFSSFKYGERIAPVRDWFVVIGVLALFLAGSILWNLWLFAKVTGGEVIGTATPQPTQIATPFASIQSIFDARQQVRDKYIQEYRLVDPSSPGR